MPVSLARLLAIEVVVGVPHGFRGRNGGHRRAVVAWRLGGRLEGREQPEQLAAALRGAHLPGGEGAPVAHHVHREPQRRHHVPGAQEIAVQGMRRPAFAIVRQGRLRRRQALRQQLPAEQTPAGLRRRRRHENAIGLAPEGDERHEHQSAPLGRHHEHTPTGPSERRPGARASRPQECVRQPLTAKPVSPKRRSVLPGTSPAPSPKNAVHPMSNSFPRARRRGRVWEQAEPAAKRGNGETGKLRFRLARGEAI